MNGLKWERAVIKAIMTTDEDGELVGVYSHQYGWSLISEILENVRKSKGDSVMYSLIKEFGLRSQGYDE
jgi:hypothetical protein